MSFTGISEPDVDRAYEVLKKDALDGGYRLNPDTEFVKNLIRGLLKNEQRYGYRACPSRSGVARCAGISVPGSSRRGSVRSAKQRKSVSSNPFFIPGYTLWKTGSSCVHVS